MGRSAANNITQSGGTEWSKRDKSTYDPTDDIEAYALNASGVVNIIVFDPKGWALFRSFKAVKEKLDTRRGSHSELETAVKDLGKAVSYIAPPDIPAGFVAVFNSDEASWHLVEDHRGKTVYDVASGDALFISELGPLPENVTWLSPEGEFQKWNGTAWVKDTEAEKLFRIREAEETKNNLMQVASEHIAPLQDAADLEIATEEEISLLEAWKKYRVLLNRVDTSTSQDIEWPALP